jgi:hypothetical protein
MLKPIGETYTKEEQEENRKLWVEALRSGEYKQTKSNLRTTEGFCCLGVACEVIGFPAVQVGFVYEYDGNTGVLSDRVKDALGLKSAGGWFSEHSETTFDNSLWKLNDEKGYTFDQIADVIESKPKGLFIEP